MRFPLAALPVAVVAALVVGVASADPLPSSPLTATQIATPGKARLDPSATSDPTNGARRLVAFTDYTNAHPRTAWLSTINGGTSWSSGTLTTVIGADTAGRPSVAWSSTGGVYMAYETDKGGDGCDETAAGIDLSVSTNAASAQPAAFGQTTRVAISNSSAGGSPNGLRRTWPSVAVDASQTATAGQPLVAFTSTTAPSCGAGVPDSSAISVAWPTSWSNPGAATWLPKNLVPADPDPEAYDFPDLVSIPAAATDFAVAYLHRTSSIQGRIEVLECDRNSCGAGPIFQSDPFALATTAPLGSGITVTSAPSLAVGPDGSLHLAYTQLNTHGDLDVMYTSSDAARANWSTPVSVASDAAAGDDQFLPSVSVSPVNGRADVAYLDDRMNGSRYAAFQTSFRGGLRGDDIRLSPTDTAPPVVGSTPTVGSRSTSMTLGATLERPLLGHLFAYWPQLAVPGNTSTATIDEGELWHGLSSPALAADPASGTTLGKNTSTGVPSSWFAVTDVDGDPVSVAVSSPAHGALAGDRSSYTPTAQFAGEDAFTVQGTDGLNATPVTHRFNVTDAAPVIGPGPTSLVGTEGQSGIALPLSATDPDPGDPVCYGASTAPALAGRVHFTPACGATTTMTVDLPNGYRPGLTNIIVHARDSTPTLGGDTTRGVVVLVQPHYATPSVTPFADVSGLAARLNFTGVTWNDIQSDCAVEGLCIYHFAYSIDGKATQQLTGSLLTPTARYAPGPHSYTVSAWLSTPNGNTPASKPVRSTFFITADPRALLRVQTARHGRSLVVKLRSRIAGAVEIRLYVSRHLPRLWKVQVSGGTVGTYRLSLRGITARTGTLKFSYVPGLAADSHAQSLNRRVWLR